MTRSSDWSRPRCEAPRWGQLLRLRAASAILCAGCLVASAQTAQGGINVWTRSNGAPDGITYTLAIDPQTSTMLYAGAADGVYKSTSGGDTWTVTGLVLTDLSGIFALAIDPQTPTTLYAGIGSTYHGGQVRAQVVVEGSEGVYKTTDGGNTWSTTGLSSPVGALAIDPQTPTTLYAGAGRFGSVEGVSKTTDGGNTWSTTGLSSPVGALAIDPQTPTTLYAGAARLGSVEGSQGVYKTTDGGDTWITLSLPAGEWSRVIGLAIDPQNPAMLYAGTERCYGCGMGGLCCVPGEAFKSTDGGDTWSRLPVAATVLSIDPQSPTTLYAVADRVFKSTDGGGTWSDLSTGLPRGYYDDEGVLALAIDPIELRRVYAATRSGVFAIEQVVVGTGTPASCTEGGLDAALAGLVTFDCGPDPVTITITSTKTIAYDTVIDGGGRITISGGNRVGVFAVNGVSLTVQNLTIADAQSSSAGSGAGIFNGSGMLTVTNSTFSGNSAGVYGGGIYSNGGTVTVTNSTFSSNRAGYGGGGIYSDTGTVTVTNSTFSSNRARYGSGGGIDSNGGTVTVTNSAFSGNSANHGGGIDSNGGRVTVTACSFSGNSAHDGGGIDSDSVLAVTNCSFSGNSAGAGGGGIDNGGTLTVTNSTFSGNSAGAGGGIYSDTGTVTVVNSTFSDNSAAPYNPGGGIFNVSGMLTVTNSTFSGNSAGFGGGIDNGGTLTVTNSTFSRNSGHDRGGGINNRGTSNSLTVTDSTFSGNSGNYGGGIDSSGGRVRVATCTFSGNSAIHDGGGIGTNSLTTLTVANSTFSGNSAGAGGGIGNVGGENGGTLTVTNSTFSDNSGGSISNSGSAAIVTNTILANSIPGGNCTGTIIDGGHNIDDGATCGFMGTGCDTTTGSSFCSTNSQLDPAGLGNNGGPTQTIALAPGSPAIDAGDPEVCANPPVSGVDQRGFVRPGTGYANCSIGAYEYDSPGPPTGCVGDCNDAGTVTIDELLAMVNVALGTIPTSACPAGDRNQDGAITVEEIITAVNVALNGGGCG